MSAPQQSSSQLVWFEPFFCPVAADVADVNHLPWAHRPFKHVALRLKKIIFRCPEGLTEVHQIFGRQVREISERARQYPCCRNDSQLHLTRTQAQGFLWRPSALVCKTSVCHLRHAFAEMLKNISCKAGQSGLEVRGQHIMLSNFQCGEGCKSCPPVSMQWVDLRIAMQWVDYRQLREILDMRLIPTHCS